MIVKEYYDESTHIRIFDDYCNKKEVKEIIISLVLTQLQRKENK